MRSFPFLAALMVLGSVVSAFGVAGCKRPAPSLVAHGDTFGEMRTIKGDVGITAKGQTKRAPYPRERVAEGDQVSLGQGALAWIRRDSGAVWLVAGPAELTLSTDAVNLASGRVFVDGEDGPPIRIDSARGAIELSDARASVDVNDGALDTYVLRGSARSLAGASKVDRAIAGERLTLKADGSVVRTPSAVSYTHLTLPTSDLV